MPGADRTSPRLLHGAVRDDAAAAAGVAMTAKAGKAQDSLYLAILIAALVLYSGCSYYAPGAAVAGAESSITAVATKYFVWLLAFAGIGSHVARHGFDRLARASAIFLPLALFGLLSAIVGINPAQSVTSLTYWLISLLTAIVIGTELDGRKVRQLLFWILFAELLASIILVHFVPQIGLVIDSRVGEVWRGAFVGKNVLGWVALWAVVLCWLCRREFGLVSLLAMAAVSSACLIGSSSQGSLATAAAVLGLTVLIGHLRRMPISIGMKLSALIAVTVFVALTVVVFMPIILELLGRDSSLTGRTDIWDAYLGYAAQRPLLGFGPGAFTTPNEITNELAVRFIRFGYIRTPHNMYIASLGEGGVVGIACFIGALGYIAFYVPFRYAGDTSLMASAAALLILTGGLVETHEIYGSGFGGFLLFLLYAMALRQAAANPGPANGHKDRSADRGMMPLGGPRAPLRTLAPALVQQIPHRRKDLWS